MGQVVIPDYLLTEEEPSQCKPRGKPFRPRSIGRYLLGRHPIRSKVVVAPTVAA